MRGRKPDPFTALSGSRPGGNRRKHVHELPPLSKVKAPDYLDEAEKALFDELAAAAPRGLLAAIDRPLVVCFVQHFQLRRRATEELNRLTFETMTAIREHPLVKIIDQQTGILIRLAETLGLCPTVRQRIKLPAVDASIGAWADVVAKCPS